MRSNKWCCRPTYCPEYCRVYVICHEYWHYAMEVSNIISTEYYKTSPMHIDFDWTVLSLVHCNTRYYGLVCVRQTAWSWTRMYVKCVLLNVLCCYHRIMRSVIYIYIYIYVLSIMELIWGKYMVCSHSSPTSGSYVLCCMRSLRIFTVI